LKRILQEQVELPAEAPIMVLPNALLFPHALLPLFIFEPRYRAMLAHALEQQRMFCIALMKPGVSEARSVEDFHQVAGLGLVRACVEREDGTSHLVLQGLTRVRFTEFSQASPFRIARISEVRSEIGDEAEARDLSARVLALCAEHRARGAEVPPALDEQLSQIADPDVMSDVVAHTFVRGVGLRQQLLEEPHVPSRLRLLMEALRGELP
jgi:Lon protease-like protein